MTNKTQNDDIALEREELAKMRELLARERQLLAIERQAVQEERERIKRDDVETCQQRYTHMSQEELDKLRKTVLYKEENRTTDQSLNHLQPKYNKRDKCFLALLIVVAISLIVFCGWVASLAGNVFAGSHFVAVIAETIVFGSMIGTIIPLWWYIWCAIFAPRPE